jgi:hypothetical protein
MGVDRERNQRFSRTMAGSSPTPVEPATVRASLERLDKEIAALREVLGELYIRIQGVCRAHPPMDGVEELKDDLSASTVRNELDRLGALVSLLRRGVEVTAASVEV